MGMVIQKEPGKSTWLGVWKIEEDEAWYLDHPLVGDALRERIGSYSVIQRKLQAIAVRILIRDLLPDEENVDIDYDEYGKPFFNSLDYNISITHSGDMAAVLISGRGDVGVDIEHNGAKVGRIAHKFLNAEELENCKNQPAGLKSDYMQVLWGAKESMFKLYGKGNVDFRSDLVVADFELKPEGTFSGVIRKDGLIKLQGFYRKVDSFVLVYVLTLPSLSA